MDKERIKEWLRPWENKLLILLMILTIAIRLYYFIRLGNQPIWWDEGDYLAISKVWALNMQKPEWWGHFTGMRPLLIPMIWFLFMKAGLGELTMRFFTLLIPSVLTVYVVYAVGRDLYNKKTGLIAGFLMSIYWVHIFYTFRLLTDIPSLFFGMLTIYFFYSLYIKRGKKYGLYLAVFAGVLAFATRFPLALVLFTCYLYIFFTRKFKMFKDKTIWISIILLILLLSPYLIYFISTNFFLFEFYFGSEAVSITNTFTYAINQVFIHLLPQLLHSLFLILFIFGLITFISLFLNFDIFWKQKDKRFNADIFVLLLLIIHLIFYIFIIRDANDRWLFMVMPPIFYITSKGIVYIYKYIKKYSKTFSIILLVGLLIFGSYQQLNHANRLIELKKGTYKEVMLAGIWLKENTLQDAKIMTASIVQNQYYSERQSYDFYVNGTYNDKNLVEEKIQQIKPDYFIVSIFETTFTPQWVYTYPEEKKLTPIKAFISTKEQQQISGIPEGSTLLVIYKF